MNIPGTSGNAAIDGMFRAVERRLEELRLQVGAASRAEYYPKIPVLPISTRTIASGVLDVITQVTQVGGEGAASDDLDTIHLNGSVGGIDGQIIYLVPSVSGDIITLKHNTGTAGGAIWTGGTDIPLATNNEVAALMYINSRWCYMNSEYF